MKKSVPFLVFFIFLIFICIAFLNTCNDPKILLSAGETIHPNSNYTVTDKNKPDYQPPHNTRVSDPYYKLNPKLSPQIPNQLKPHSRLLLTDVEDRTFFDYFAWQTFIGLIWPADSTLRGVADAKVTPLKFKEYNTTAKDNPKRVPVVWETFQTFDKALPNDSLMLKTPPKAWNYNPYSRPFNLDLTSKGHSITELDEAFSYPLIDKNHQYVRYNLQMNKVMYEFIRQNKWYLKRNLPKSPTQATLPPLPVNSDGKIIAQQQPQTNTIITQPVNGNSIEIKSSWRIMITEKDTTGKSWRKIDDLSRYFVSEANVTNVENGDTIKNQLVGLVGLHIVVKTPQFTQGIWASFEHIDNVSDAPKGIIPSFNAKREFQDKGYSYIPKKFKTEKDRKPVAVSRIYKIPNTPVGISPTLPDGLSTVALNKAYKKLLKGTVWKNYRLVITQWPTDPTSFYAAPFLLPRGKNSNSNQPLAVQEAYKRAEKNSKNAYPRWSGLPVPQSGALNTTMETYFQNPKKTSLGDSSCMGCHYGASDTDYSWGLKLRTWPQPYNQGRINSKNERKLKNPANVKKDSLIIIPTLH
jgi:hypothetical protein